MNEKIKFTARVISADGRIKSLSGRLGNFIFRTYQNGKIFAYYSPRKGIDRSLPPSGEHRAVIEAISNQFRDITRQVNLSIEELNFE